METELCILTCKYFEDELRAAVASDDFENVTVATFPARCGRPPIGWDDIARTVHKPLDSQQTLILGGCCLAGLKNPPENLNRCQIRKLEQCFYMLADRSVIDQYISAGKYLLTPRWLACWRGQIKAWGFTPENARDFFFESANNLMLLDTGVDADSSKHLREFSDFVDRPYEIIKTGIEFFRLFLSRIVLQWRLECEKNKSRMALNDAHKQSAEYAMAMELFNNLALHIKEEQAIRDIVDTFTMLVAPESICYLILEDGKPGKVFQSLSSSFEENEAIRDRLMDLDQDYVWNESGSGFLLRIKGRGKVLGILEAEHLAFPEHRDNYLNLALTVAGVCGIVIENARMYQDLIRSNKSLEQARIRADDARLAKSVFLANMSHEIRTPMNAILGFSQILKNRESDPKNKYYADSIFTSGSALLALINDILDLSRIESGKMQLQYSAVSLPFLSNELEMLFSQKTAEKGLLFKLCIDENIPKSLVLDEGRLRQVFINLVGNAIKFTHSGFVKFTAACCFSEEASRSRVSLSFSISDSGIGIPKEQKDKIFTSFEQVKRRKGEEYEGTGLGLSITKQIIELMGGTIAVESEEGVGSNFTIFIPDVEIASGVAISKDNNIVGASTVTFAPAVILVADDIDYNLEIMSAYLSEWDFTIHYASNGKETLEKADELSPDLILLDMRMPIMDGYEASAKLKESAKTRNIPIIAITAFALKQEEEIIRKTCDGYVRKLVIQSDLIKELMKYLPHKILEKETPVSDEPMPDKSSRELAKDIPKALIGDISEAIEDGDMNKLMKLTEQVERYDKITAEKIRQLAEQYDYDALLKILT